MPIVAATVTALKCKVVFLYSRKCLSVNFTLSKSLFVAIFMIVSLELIMRFHFCKLNFVIRHNVFYGQMRRCATQTVIRETLCMKAYNACMDIERLFL